MAEGVRKTQRTTLFLRIMTRLSFPLFFLGAAFTAVQLTNQVNALNELYRIESRSAFQAAQQALETEINQPENFSKPEAFQAKLNGFLNFHRITDIQIFNLLSHAPLFPARGGKGPQSKWTELDAKSVDESLYQKQLGKSYHVVVDKENKQLVAYIPLETADKNQVLIARAIYPLSNIKEAFIESRWTLGIILFFITCAGLLIGQALARSIVRPIQTLNKATQHIMRGKLGEHVSIHTGDEIEMLASAFNQMSDTLKEMKQRAEDANPLTGLPGNQGIFHEIKKRIYERQKFVLFHIDLDRFKVFNDHFGLARGDEAIKRTADLLKKVVEETGAADDFVGHQGGDDFVLLTRPNHAEALAETICKQFDAEVVPALYRKQDLDQGYTLQVDRRRLAETGEEVVIKFPLLAISAAGISNAKKDFADYFQCMSAAAEVKKEVKKTVQSSFLIKE